MRLRWLILVAPTCLAGCAFIEWAEGLATLLLGLGLLFLPVALGAAILELVRLALDRRLLRRVESGEAGGSRVALRGQVAGSGLGQGALFRACRLSYTVEDDGTSFRDMTLFQAPGTFALQTDSGEALVSLPETFGQAADIDDLWLGGEIPGIQVHKGRTRFFLRGHHRALEWRSSQDDEQELRPLLGALEIYAPGFDLMALDGGKLSSAELSLWEVPAGETLTVVGRAAPVRPEREETSHPYRAGGARTVAFEDGKRRHLVLANFDGDDLAAVLSNASREARVGVGMIAVLLPLDVLFLWLLVR